MSNVVFELFAKLGLDSSEYEKGLGDAKSKASSIGGAIGNGLKTAAKIGGAAIATATAAVGAFATSSVSAATSFESAFTGVRKTVDATEEEYGQLSDWIMEASTKMASSKEDIAATMEIAGQLGVRGVDGLEKFTETMIMLGDTTNLNAEEAASALAKFGNIAGLQPTDMDRIGSAIVDLGNHFATTEADITAMATRLASAGTIAGLSATDILGLSTAMSSVGIQAEAGGTAMAQTMASMTKAVEEALPYLSQPYETLDDEALAAMESLYQYADVSGMTAQEFAEAWKGEPIKAIQAFIGGLGEMNEADQSVVMMLDEMGLEGIRQSNMLQALALASDTMTDAVNTANTAFEENVALQNEANTRYGTTESQMLQAAEAFKNLKVVVGQELMPTMQQFIGFATTAMQDISKGLQEGGLEGMMSSMGVAISDGLAMVTEMLPEAINAGMELLGAVGQGILDNLPVIIDAATQIIPMLGQGIMQALPALLDGAIQIISQLGAFLIESLPTMIPAIIQLVTQLGLMLAENASALVNGIIALVTGIAVELINNLPLLLDAVIQITIALAQAIIENLPVFVDACVQILMAIVALIVEYGGQFLASAGEVFGNLINSVGEWMGGLIESISTWLSELPTQMAYWAGFAIGSFIKFFMDLPENLKTCLNETKQKAIEFGTEFKNEAYNTGRNFFNSLIDNIKQLPERLRALGNSLVSAVASLPSKFTEIGKNIVSGLWNGIQERWQWLKDKVSELANSLLQGAKDALGIESPSKEFAYVGRMVDEGFAKGLDNFSYLISDAMDMITGDMLNVTPQVALADGVAPTTAPAYNQTVNVYSPTALTPSEVARQTRNATRDMVLELRGKR